MQSVGAVSESAAVSGRHTAQCLSLGHPGRTRPERGRWVLATYRPDSPLTGPPGRLCSPASARRTARASSWPRSALAQLGALLQVVDIAISALLLTASPRRPARPRGPPPAL